ncbi:serine hydrolase [Caulobacter segnis]|uniref:serine hydrolase domain-containing protein n=1 Tax=Caulobacter segnis TaxID=88688 RepID=UPI002410534A|nr:serine hydrolase domain-containing protein [Caulobacter segnis]MDG2521901.1 serine hydrolase [Caulobacter segnis]
MTRRFNWAAAAVAAILASAPACQAQTTSAPASAASKDAAFQSLDASMHALVDQGRLPGVATYVVKGGKVIHQDIYGKADLTTGAPLKADTIYRIYSQTKPVTGVAMMMLYEEGKWSLDDPITKFLPELANLKVFKGVGADGKTITEPAKRPATMRELMSHQAGFAYGLQVDNPVDKAYRDSGLLGSPTPEAFLKTLAALPLMGQPGEQWKYSVAVDLQGLIVERLSGKKLGAFMQERIFAPLGMVDTGFWLPAEKQGRLASLYLVNPADKKVVPAQGFMVLDVTKQPAVESGGGGLVSTTADYAKFSQMLLNGGELGGKRLLKPETVKLMRTNHLTEASLAKLPLGPGVGFGLDFATVMDPAKAGTPMGKDTYSWGGAAGTWFWIDPTNDLFVLGMIQVLGRPDSDPRMDALSAPSVYRAIHAH